MTSLIKAELRKILSIRVWWILLLAALAWAAVMLAGTYFIAGFGDGPGRAGPEYAAMAWPQLSVGMTFAMIVGVLMVTSEYQHRTVNVTFLVTPKRARVVGAKLIAAALVGLGYGLVLSLLGGGFIVGSVLAAGGSLDLAANEVPRMVAGSIAAHVVYAMIGVGIGALVRNQVAALVLVLLWLFMVEPAFMIIPVDWVQTVATWLPGSAIASFYATGAADYGFEHAQYLPVWAAALALVGYAVVASLIATATTVRRDLA